MSLKVNFQIYLDDAVNCVRKEESMKQKISLFISMLLCFCMLRDTEAPDKEQLIRQLQDILENL